MKKAGLATLSTLFLSIAACSSSSSSVASSAEDAGVAADGSTSDGATATDAADAAAQNDSSTPAKGLVISNATAAALNGTYDIQIHRIANGASLAFNGNFQGRIEMEIDTDTNGAIKTGHFWNYLSDGGAVDKYYGCDGKATPCTSFTVNLATNVITLNGVVWPEVQSPSFDGTTADTLVPSGSKVTLSGVLQAQ
jgi:hypothetical protein